MKIVDAAQSAIARVLANIYKRILTLKVYIDELMRGRNGATEVNFGSGTRPYLMEQHRKNV